MWPFTQQIKTFESIKSAKRVLKKQVDLETVTEAYSILCAELASRLEAQNLSDFQRQQNLRDINEITMYMTQLVIHYDSAPGFFRRENVLSISRLIGRAAKYVKGTKYEYQVSGRRVGFDRGVILERASYESIRVA